MATIDARKRALDRAESELHAAEWRVTLEAELTLAAWSSIPEAARPAGLSYLMDGLQEALTKARQAEAAKRAAMDAWVRS